MLLESLNQFYRNAVKNGTIEREGWKKQSFALGFFLDLDGNLVSVRDIRIEKAEKNAAGSGQPEKKRMEKRMVNAPMKPPSRTRSIIPSMVSDGAKYAIGVSVADETYIFHKEAFLAFRDKQHEILDGSEDEEAKAFLKFLDNWNPENIKNIIPEQNGVDEKERDKDKENLFKLIGSIDNNILFVITPDHILLENKEVCRRIDEAIAQDEETGRIVQGATMQCLVTGNISNRIMRIHSNAYGNLSLVSMNTGAADSYSSYGREQAENAPVSYEAEKGYIGALAYLLSNNEGKTCARIGKTLLVFWTDNEESDGSCDLISAMIENKNGPESMKDARKAFEELSNGRPYNDFSPGTKSYFLVLNAGGKGRLAVMDFQIGTMGRIGKNVNMHNERMCIDGFRCHVSLFSLLNSLLAKEEERKNKNNSGENKLKDKMASELAGAIFFGRNYPIYLLSCAISLVETDKTPGNVILMKKNCTREQDKINWRLKVCMSYIKAFYLKNKDVRCPEEVLTVNVNENSSYVPYVWGRIFAAVEKEQIKVNEIIYKEEGRKKPTVKDKFFTMAMSNPAAAYAETMRTYEIYHGKRISMTGDDYSGIITKLVEKIADNNEVTENGPIPCRPYTQGEKAAFLMGYYHQWAYMKKAKTKETKNADDADVEGSQDTVSGDQEGE